MPKILSFYDITKFSWKTTFANAWKLLGETERLFHDLPLVSDKQLTELICFQHVVEFTCYVVLPKCDIENNQLIVPCKETCDDFAECLHWYIPSYHPAMFADCSYLPSVTGSIPCYYKPVTCETPPNVANDAIVRGIKENNTYLAKSKVEYSCFGDDMEIEGNGTIICYHSGHWYETPVCLQRSAIHPLMIVLPLFLVSLATLIGICIWSWCKHKSEFEILTRNKEFDAFVMIRLMRNLFIVQ